MSTGSYDGGTPGSCSDMTNRRDGLLLTNFSDYIYGIYDLTFYVAELGNAKLPARPDTQYTVYDER